MQEQEIYCGECGRILTVEEDNGFLPLHSRPNGGLCVEGIGGESQAVPLMAVNG
jgi:hypothetical protein